MPNKRATRKDVGAGDKRRRPRAGVAGELRFAAARLADREALLLAQADHLDRQSELLSAGRQQFGELFDFAPVALITSDDAGIIREVNTTAAAFLGGSRLTLLGLPLFRFIAAEDRRAFGRHLARCRRRPGMVTATELHLSPPDRAAPVPVRLVSKRAPYLGPSSSGKQAWWTAIHDLTLQSQLDSEARRLQQYQQAARQANEAKDLFIAVLSHELRAPLTALLNAATMMAEGTLGADDQQRIAGLVRRSANAQARLIEDLMDLTRITRGKVRLELAPTDVHALVKETLEVFGPEIDAKGLEVAVHLDADDRVVNGDAGRLRQVFSNLIRNACKFTPSGGQIAVRSWNHQQRLLVEVADTGMGLEAAQIERLFVPFEQASSGAGGGVGLGLAIVKGIVDLHGGRIGASSPGRDKGSRFVVDLGAVASADLSTRRTMELATIGERKAPS